MHETLDQDWLDYFDYFDEMDYVDEADWLDYLDCLAGGAREWDRWVEGDR